MESNEFSSFAETLPAHNQFVLLDDTAAVEADSASARILAIEFGVLVVKSVGHAKVSFIIVLSKLNLLTQ